jgi:hypothetical protein
VPVKPPEQKKGQRQRYQASKHLAIATLAACALRQFMHPGACWGLHPAIKKITTHDK